MSSLQVELVAADRRVWEGEAAWSAPAPSTASSASCPATRPLLGVLVDGRRGHPRSRAATRPPTIDSGFISVEHDRVTIIAESVGASHGHELTGPRQPHTPMPDRPSLRRDRGRGALILLAVFLADVLFVAAPADLLRGAILFVPAAGAPPPQPLAPGPPAPRDTRLEWFSLLGVSPRPSPAGTASASTSSPAAACPSTTAVAGPARGGARSSCHYGSRHLLRLALRAARPTRRCASWLDELATPGFNVNVGLTLAPYCAGLDHAA